MYFRTLSLITLATLLLAAFSVWQPESPMRHASSKESVGTATMRKDGTVVLNIAADDRGLGLVEIEYPRGDPFYDELLKRTGGLEPGESKVVPGRP